MRSQMELAGWEPAVRPCAENTVIAQIYKTWLDAKDERSAHRLKSILCRFRGAPDRVSVSPCCDDRYRATCHSGPQMPASITSLRDRSRLTNRGRNNENFHRSYEPRSCSPGDTACWMQQLFGQSNRTFVYHEQHSDNCRWELGRVLSASANGRQNVAVLGVHSQVHLDGRGKRNRYSYAERVDHLGNLESFTRGDVLRQQLSGSHSSQSRNVHAVRSIERHVECDIEHKFQPQPRESRSG